MSYLHETACSLFCYVELVQGDSEAPKFALFGHSAQLFQGFENVLMDGLDEFERITFFRTRRVRIWFVAQSGTYVVIIPFQLQYVIMMLGKMEPMT